MANKEEAFLRASADELVISFYTSAPYNLTPQEARRIIKYRLDHSNFMVNVHPIDQTKLDAATRTNYSGIVVQAGIENGMVWVRANADNTDDTGEIFAGQPVVFDSKSGNAVTGINEKWGPEEYKIVGVAWKNFSHPDEGKIPITLVHDFDRPQEGMLGRLYETLQYRQEARVIPLVYDYTVGNEVDMKDYTIFPITTQLMQVVARDAFLRQAGDTLETDSRVWVQKWGSKKYVTQATCG